MPDIHVDAVALFVSAVGFIAWLVRVEVKTSQNEKDIAEHKKEAETVNKTLFDKVEGASTAHTNLEREMLNKLGAISTSLAKIEGYLQGYNYKKE